MTAPYTPSFPIAVPILVPINDVTKYRDVPVFRFSVLSSNPCITTSDASSTGALRDRRPIRLIVSHMSSPNPSSFLAPTALHLSLSVRLFLIVYISHPVPFRNPGCNEKEKCLCVCVCTRNRWQMRDYYCASFLRWHSPPIQIFQFNFSSYPTRTGLATFRS